MIAKKNKKYNLERKRFAFFQIGLLISGSLCLAAFEYTTAKPEGYTYVSHDDGGVYVWEDPETEKEFKFVEELQPQPKVVSIADLTEVKIVDRIEKKGDVVVTSNPDIITMDGDGKIDQWSYVETGIDVDGEWDWEIVEKDPEFPGGVDAMFGFIQRNIEYPQLMREMGIQGTVYVHFVVSKTGEITKITSSGAPHEDLSSEAIRVVKKMPKWIPGEQAGKKVNVKFTLPVRFTIH